MKKEYVLEEEKSWFFSELSQWGKKLDYTGPTSSFNAAIEDVLQRCKINGSRKEKYALKVILLNLVYIDVVTESKGCMDILLGHDNTGKGTLSEYVYGCGKSVLRNVVYALKDADLILHQKGIPGDEGKGNEGHSTKVRLTKTGLDLIANRILVASIIKEEEPIRCEDASGNYCKPSISVADKAKRTLIVRYNKLLCDTKITVGDSQLYGLEKTIYRKFADKSGKADGRLYGALYQRMSKKLRQELKIKGDRTIEVDIKSTHPLIIYSEIGVDITSDNKIIKSIMIGKDPYRVYMLPYSNVSRRIVKSLVVVMLNLKGKDGESDERFASRVSKVYWRDYEMAFSSGDVEKEEQAWEEVLLLRKAAVDNSKEYDFDQDGNETGIVNYDDNAMYDIKDVVLEILRRHEDIRGWFGSEAWRKLNNIESNILLKVIRHFTDKGIPVITVHDSVRIAEQHEAELVEVFTKAIEDTLKMSFKKYQPLVTVDRDGSGLEKEELYRLLKESRYTDKLDQWGVGF